jgi:hypothetical protein
MVLAVRAVRICQRWSDKPTTPVTIRPEPWGPVGSAKAAQETANHLRPKADWSGVKVWEAVAAELIKDARRCATMIGAGS